MVEYDLHRNAKKYVIIYGIFLKGCNFFIIGKHKIFTNRRRLSWVDFRDDQHNSQFNWLIG